MHSANVPGASIREDQISKTATRDGFVSPLSSTALVSARTLRTGMQGYARLIESPD